MPEGGLAFLWESQAVLAKLSRALLAPLGAAFTAGVALRNGAYDRGLLRSHHLALPTIGVGNLTVGGTGKTPVSAWLADQLAARGERPAIVLRGYGDDEQLVHARLSPGTAIIADADRVRGVARARAAGATVAVLDDGFQHRRARRDADLVIISADRFGAVRPLPVGPWREPLTSLVRATAIVVTRKAVSLDRARDVLSEAMRFAPHALGVVIDLTSDTLVNTVSGDRQPLAALAGDDALAISAIGDPQSFASQLRAAGARVTSSAFPDHHHFSAADVASLSNSGRRAKWVVCTLKDAVKLESRWPREGPSLWYLSQRVSVEMGREALGGLLAGLVSSSAPQINITPAPAGPTTEPNVP